MKVGLESCQAALPDDIAQSKAVRAGRRMVGRLLHNIYDRLEEERRDNPIKPDAWTVHQAATRVFGHADQSENNPATATPSAERESLMTSISELLEENARLELALLEGWLNKLEEGPAEQFRQALLDAGRIMAAHVVQHTIHAGDGADIRDAETVYGLDPSPSAVPAGQSS